MNKPLIFIFLLLTMAVSVNALPINRSFNYTIPFSIDDRDSLTAPNQEFTLPMDLNFDGYYETIVVCRDSRGFCNTAIDDTKFTVKITLSSHQPINSTSGFGANIGDPYALFFVIVDSNGVPVLTNTLTGNISNNFTQQKFAYLKGNGGSNAGIYQINANRLTIYGVEFDPQVYTTKNTEENPILKTTEDFTMSVVATDDAEIVYDYKWFINGERVLFASGDDYTISGSEVGEGTFVVTVQTDNLYTQTNDTWTINYFEGYAPTYTSSDVSKIAFDFTGNLLVMFVFMAGVIGLGYVFIMYKKANK